METTNLPLQPRRSTSGAVDLDDYRPQANQLRAEAVREIGRDLASTLARLARRVHAAIHDYRQRRAAYRELTALDAQALHDIGVSRSDIDAIASGRLSDDRSRCRKHVAMSLDKPATVVPWRERTRPGIRSAAASPCAE
jgi:uncharacterized protein YjiS (DUF1127 family)